MALTFFALREAGYGPERQFAAPRRHSRYLESCGHASVSLIRRDRPKGDLDDFRCVRCRSQGKSCSQLSQEIDHSRADLRRALLLGPMAAAGEHELATQ